MKLIIFEECVYRKKTEKSFYLYCMLRQISLIKYAPFYFLLGILKYFHIIKEMRYLEKRWSFLANLKNREKLIEGFAKKAKFFIPESDMTVLSHHPNSIIKPMLCCKCVASEYDETEKKFLNYVNYSEYACSCKSDFTAYGHISSPIMQSAFARVYVFGRKLFSSRVKYIRMRAVHFTSSVLFIAAVSSFWAVVGMYFSSRTYSARSELFKSYFSRFELVLLNILPVLITALLLWLLSNSVTFSIFTTGFLTLILSLVNYFKILFRNDPFLVEDFKYINEAGNMTSKFDVNITPNMIICFVLLFVFAVVGRLLFNAKIKLNYVRPTVFIVLSAVTAFGMKWYLSEDTYIRNQNNSCGIVKWSATQQFISRGFVYPFIHSLNTAFDTAPDNYNEKETEKILSQYKDEDIPEEKRVNILSFMLEAYTDLDRFGVLEFTDDVYSFLHELQKESYSGYLVTDIFAAGTITTERQFLTGMNYLPSFRSNTNSYVWYLRSQGYDTQGYHPSYSWFYNRRNINEHLGFSNYYFDDVILDNTEGHYRYETNYLMFPDVLNNYRKGIENGGNYFSFNITYQGHSPYSEDYCWFDREYIKNKGYTEGEYNILNNYLFNIDSANTELEKLINELRYDSEPVILIFFGDHMPWLGNNASIYKMLGINLDLSTEEGFYNYYMTPFVVWANEEAKRISGNDFVGDAGKIGAYMLMSRVFEMLGWKGDSFNQYITHVSKTVAVDHVTGATLTSDGTLSMEPNPEISELVSRYENVQYYQRHHFKYGTQ